MRRFLMILCSWTAAMALPAAATNVEFSYGNFGQVLQTKRPLLLYPVLVPATNTSGVTTGDRIATTTGKEGSVTISNVLPGWVRGEFYGVWRVSTNWFLIPDTNIVVRAGDCLATNYLVGGSLPAPSPWWSKAELAAGNQTSFRTNGGKVLIDAIVGSPTTYTTNSGYANDPTAATLHVYGSGSEPFNTPSKYLFSRKTPDIWTNAFFKITPISDIDWKVCSSDDQTNYGDSISSGMPRSPWFAAWTDYVSSVAVEQVLTNSITTNSSAGYYLRLDSTGTNLIYSPD